MNKLCFFCVTLLDVSNGVTSQIPTDPSELFRIVMCALKSNLSVHIDGFIYQPIDNK